MFPKQSRQHWGRLCSHQSRCAATPSAKTCANNSHVPIDAHMIIQFVTSDGGECSEARQPQDCRRSLKETSIPLRLPLSRLYSGMSHGEWRLHPFQITVSRSQPVAWHGSSPSSCFPRLCFRSGAHPGEGGTLLAWLLTLVADTHCNIMPYDRLSLFMGCHCRTASQHPIFAAFSIAT